MTWTYLCLEEFLIRFEFLGETFVRVTQMLCFVTNTSCERVVNFSLNVVLMEFSLVLFEIFELSANVLVNALSFHINMWADLVIRLLLFIEHFLNLGVAGSEGAQLFDFGCKSVFLFLNFIFNLLDQLVKFLQWFALLIIKLLLKLRDTLNLVFDIRVPGNSLFGL